MFLLLLLFSVLFVCVCVFFRSIHPYRIARPKCQQHSIYPFETQQNRNNNKNMQTKIARDIIKRHDFGTIPSTIRIAKNESNKQNRKKQNYNNKSMIYFDMAEFIVHIEKRHRNRANRKRAFGAWMNIYKLILSLLNVEDTRRKQYAYNFYMFAVSFEVSGNFLTR